MPNTYKDHGVQDEQPREITTYTEYLEQTKNIFASHSRLRTMSHSTSRTYTSASSSGDPTKSHFMILLYPVQYVRLVYLFISSSLHPRTRYPGTGPGHTFVHRVPHSPQYFHLYRLPGSDTVLNIAFIYLR